MGYQERHRRITWLAVGVLLLGGIILGGGSRELPAGEAPREAQPSSFLLTVHEGRLSLRAQDASLKAIIEEIGRRLQIETVVQLSPEARVPLAFDQLSLAQAITALREHATIGYVERGTGEEPRRITKIFAFAKGAGGLSPVGRPQEADTKPAERPIDSERRTGEGPTGTDSRRSAGFKFEFDPSQFIQPGR